MELTELDRLEQSIQRALDRIGVLEADNQKLSEDKARLESRLGTETARSSARFAEIAVLPSADKVAELKARLTRLVELIRDYERTL